MFKKDRMGNKLPEPFALFTILFLLTAAVSTAMAWAHVQVQVPGTEDPVAVRGLFTGEGIAWFTTTVGENYIGFPPLVTVATILLAIGIAEKSGFLAAAIRFTIGSAPRWLLPYTVGFVGVVGSIMADSAFVVIPPLAALAFKAAGRHPVAGLLGGFAAAGAGYSTNIFPTSLDALFAGITNAVIPTVPALAESATEVNPLSNYWFNIVAALVLSLVAGWVIDRIVEPRVERAGVSRDEVNPETAQLMTDTRAIRIVGDEQTVAESREPDVEAALSPREKKALAWACTVFVPVSYTHLTLPTTPYV